ncbi:MAG TPA: hypothetical protein VFF07_13510 [Actinomycetota bacterium]|nr:hypothetical protein [Actinomycetota bacterium]
MSEHGASVPGERSLESFLANISGLPEGLYGFPFTTPGLFLELRRVPMLERHELLRELSRKIQGQFVESLGAVV